MPTRNKTSRVARESALWEPPMLEGRGYPRPQLQRRQWGQLNGRWEFSIDAKGEWIQPGQVPFERTIEVPFSPEAERSGVGDTGLFRACWYRRTFRTPELQPDQRLVLHFGAVDYRAKVWIDGRSVLEHEGGYSPFSEDITAWIEPGADCEIVVQAFDDPVDLAKPRGKQDWLEEPHSIWYPRTSGIWQTVWYEVVPQVRIQTLRWSTNLERWEIGLEAHLSAAAEPLFLEAQLAAGDVLLAEDRFSVLGGEVHRRIALSDPGIDDSRNELLWRPEAPRLITAELRLCTRDGRVLDEVRSYTALRSFVVSGDRFLLNGRPYPLRMVLDQGYWPQTGATAPDDAALRKDVELAKAMGFNGVRKHQKVEDPRYLYWADHLGLLVWEEMPSAYRFTTRSVDRLTRQWLDVLDRDRSHPCVVVWVPFNESWGVPNLPESQSERDYVHGMYHLTKTIDPTRLVVGNDGWEASATDIIGIHDYEHRPEKIHGRYHTHASLPDLLKRERPGGRVLLLGAAADVAHPIVLSEFGGISCPRKPDAWGYSVCDTPQELEKRYRALLEVVRGLETLAGFCYTQFADCYQENNGLLFADRRPKFPLASIAAATRGQTPEIAP